MLKFYRKPALSESRIDKILCDTKQRLNLDRYKRMETEYCFYIKTSGYLTKSDLCRLKWLLSETFGPDNFGELSHLTGYPEVLEIGPRLNFETARSAKAVSVCHACGLRKILRIERSVRFGLPVKLTEEQKNKFLKPLHDRMTQVWYREQLKSFDSGITPEPVRIIPVIEQGMDVLYSISKKLGFGWDEQDCQICFDFFVNILKRNPTDVELFQLAQANSEHSRHHFFKGKLVIDGKEIKKRLMDIIKEPWKINPGNSLIAFCDDSSAMRGNYINTLIPCKSGRPGPLDLKKVFYHLTLTAETHNHPSGICPYAGAETGPGGRIRDGQVTGRGSLVGAGGAAYCAGNLLIPGYNLPWENDGWNHPKDLSSPLDILIQASDGASDYGNCFGEPLIYGFTRTFGMNLSEGYRSWYKPIVYTVGAGQINDKHIKKQELLKGMLVIQIGGPAYRIGLGGGSGSSMIKGDNTEDLDFNSVQRGDAEMEQRMNRVIRACVESLDNNPIAVAVDLGAGGDCNALPEIIYPAGAKIYLRNIPAGDKTLSTLEIWGNESQERNALVIKPERFDELKEICDLENVPCAIVGQITNDGFVILHDENDGSAPVNLPLDKILGDLPQKTFNLKRVTPKREPLKLPKDLSIKEALDLVLRLPSVASKRFLTTKVDRSVTGLVAQQQCVGPNQITLSDYAVMAQSHFGLTGTALSLGEQPIKGLISPRAMARMAVAEALLNMAGAKITKMEDIKCSANWMLAAKQPGEGAWLYDVACALRDILIELGIAIDGGKDSLSMAANTVAPDKSNQIVKAPGELVIANYAPMNNITYKATPDLKKPGNSLVFIDLARGKTRLGGSALAQVYKQVGSASPDIEDSGLLKRVFCIVQDLVKQGLIYSMHDRSDGGLITALCEMAFAGNVGLDIKLRGGTQADINKILFNEEAGLIIECKDFRRVADILGNEKIPFQLIGFVGPYDGHVTVSYNREKVLNEKMTDLRAIWEETSAQIDRLQANPDCVKEEKALNKDLVVKPNYGLTFIPKPIPKNILESIQKPKVAILREQGSNGDREMASAFDLAGFEVWDVNMNHLINGLVSLDDFQGIVFVGGFSFGDVLDAGKGWAGVIKFNKKLKEMFDRFYDRPDTFSFGVCNGCQLMALLGWVPGLNLSPQEQPRFIKNISERFESRFSTVKIVSDLPIMFRGMKDSVLGVWAAHGEGRFYAPSIEIQNIILNNNLAPLRFVHYNNEPTAAYPLNPNGSPEGITALASLNGRHLAMMPHPERTFLTWQWPWVPDHWKDLEVGPWLKIFQNAYDWCVEN